MTRAPTARLFAALEMPLPVREALLGWSRGALPALSHDAARAREGSRDGVRLLDAELMHVTLCFLGARPVAEIDGLIAALTAFDGCSCELALGAPVWLPPRNPCALTVAITDDAGGLERLQARLALALALASGWEPERRRFRAHVTVARLRGRRGGAAGLEGAVLPPTPALRFSARTISLYRSRLSPAG